MQTKLATVAITKVIDVKVSFLRLTRFLNLPEVVPAPASPPSLPPYERWRTAEPLEDEDAPLLELRGAAFTWGEVQAGVEASERNSKARPCNAQANLDLFMTQPWLIISLIAPGTARAGTCGEC